MRTRVIAALSMILIAAASAAQTPLESTPMEPTPTPVIGQLLVNPSFESPATGQGQPEGWMQNGGERILNAVQFGGVDPPEETYPDGRQIARAFAVNQGHVWKNTGWYQLVQVVPGESYTLAGHIWTSRFNVTWPKLLPYDMVYARIGADLDGRAADSAGADIWCATPDSIDDTQGWYGSDGAWTRMSARFTARGDYITVFAEARTLIPPEWNGAYFDNITLTGPVPEPSAITPTPQPTPTPTPAVPRYVGRFARKWNEAPPLPERANRLESVLLTFKDRLYLIGGARGTANSYRDVFSTTDGVNWDVLTSAAPWSARGHHAGVVFNGSMWILGGSSQYEFGQMNDVWKSDDGIDWTEVLKEAPWAPRSDHAAVVHNGAIYLMGGMGSSKNYYNDVWSSTDGVHWEQVRAQAPWFPRQELMAISFQGKLWVLSGQTWNDIWCSDDGTAWEMVHLSAPWEYRRGLSVCLYDDRIWLFSGVGASYANLNDVWVSGDGIRWAKAEGEMPWSRRCGHATGVVNGRLILMGGDILPWYNSPMSDIWYSDDLPTEAPSLMMR